MLPPFSFNSFNVNLSKCIQSDYSCVWRSRTKGIQKQTAFWILKSKHVWCEFKALNSALRASARPCPCVDLVPKALIAMCLPESCLMFYKPKHNYSRHRRAPSLHRTRSRLKSRTRQKVFPFPQLRSGSLAANHPGSLDLSFEVKCQKTSTGKMYSNKML